MTPDLKRKIGAIMAHVADARFFGLPPLEEIAVMNLLADPEVVEWIEQTRATERHR